MRDSEERQYTKEWLQERPQPMYDHNIEDFYEDFYHTSMIPTNDELSNHFKSLFHRWLTDRWYSKFEGLEAFPHRDIIYGCTQFIDDIYQRVGVDKIQIVEGDYTYHWRLNKQIQYPKIGELDPNKELIIALPFPKYGDVHPWMSFLLDECHVKNIPVHIDGAWIGSCRDINFNFDHPAIKTIGVSLSKAGMGANRVGVRYSRERPDGAVTIMNDFSMIQQALLKIGIAFIQRFDPEYFWYHYRIKYEKICNDFDLKPTKCIHLAMKEIDGQLHPRGVRPLLRCL
jgi:hypothetical protein